MKAVFFAHSITAEIDGTQKVKLTEATGIITPDFNLTGELPDLVILTENTFTAGKNYVLDISEYVPPAADSSSEESGDTADTQGAADQDGSNGGASDSGAAAGSAGAAASNASSESAAGAAPGDNQAAAGLADDTSYKP